MPWSCRRPNSAFTLPEVLISLAILLVILVTLLQFVTDTATVWKKNAADSFSEAQNAFEIMARNLADATLEPYHDYADSNGNFRAAVTSASFIPDHLARRSDLDFVCGPAGGANGLLTPSGRTTTGTAVFFLAPQGYTQTYAHEGMGRLLNALGYFVEFGDDQSAPAFVLGQNHFWRWRLKQLLQPSESLGIFAAPNISSSAWLQTIEPPQVVNSVLAENIVTLIMMPERAANDNGPALAPNFSYDSRDASNRLTLHQLPARVCLALVAMDAASAERLARLNGSTPPQLVPTGLFQNATQAQLTADLATLDASLTAQKIEHRIYRRDILLTSAAWSNTPSP